MVLHCQKRKKAGRQYGQVGGEKRREERERERVGAYSAGRVRGCISSVLVCGVLFFFFLFKDGRYIGTSVSMSCRECRVAVSNYIGRAFIFISICGGIFTSITSPTKLLR